MGVEISSPKLSRAVWSRKSMASSVISLSRMLTRSLPRRSVVERRFCAEAPLAPIGRRRGVAFERGLLRERSAKQFEQPRDLRIITTLDRRDDGVLREI